jgi:hypothetical protein
MGRIVSAPKPYKAVLGTMGEVIKGAEVSVSEAISQRRQGTDIVVCGESIRENMLLAQHIENSATGGKFKFHTAHRKTGIHALSHFQPEPRGLEGHTFFEAPPHRLAR